MHRSSFWFARTLAVVVVIAAATLTLGIRESTGAEPTAQQADRLAQLETFARTAQQQWDVPGMAIAIVKDDEVIYAKGFGVKRVGGTDPVDADTIFEIGSTSKAFTAAVVAMQVDDGKIGWSDRVIDHLPAFEMHDPWVTREFQVVDLMAQHSGMPAYAGDGMAFLGFPADYIVAHMKHLEPVTSFRTEFAYVNNLFLVAGDLARSSSGKTWAENVQQRVFAPLGMRSSSSGQAAFEAASNVAAPHKVVGGSVTPFASDAPQLAWAYEYGPAGGINSTVRDMAQWLRMLLGNGAFEGKQIVSAENLSVVMSPHTFIHFPKTGPLATTPLGLAQSFYCAGWMSTDTKPSRVVWHNGDNNFMHAAIGVIPDEHAGIVVLTNLGGTSLAEAVMWKFYDLESGNPDKDWSALFRQAWADQQKAAQAPFIQPPADPSPPEPLARYVGTFSNPVYGDLRVETDGRQLWLVAGPKQLKMLLVPRSRDTFIASQPDLDAFLGESGFATFAFGGDGKIASITLSEFADVDGGRFRIKPAS
jgi:CubicO group peptidase (beta-lactamase class C family)